MNTKSTSVPNKYIVLGASAGGVYALKTIVKDLSVPTDVVIVIVLHRLKNVSSRLDKLIQSFTSVEVIEVEDKINIEGGKIYICPSNYHLLVESDNTFSLSVSERVNFSRPSIDVSFVSFAQTFPNKTIAFLLTGANEDGARGLEVLYNAGGTCCVQHPETAQVAVMPKAGLMSVPKAKKLHLEEIAAFINAL